MTSTVRLRYPFAGTYPISQRFGERPEVYAEWNLDGHEGVDWPLLMGTPVLAMADGLVKRAETVEGEVTKNPYGLNVRLRHLWGETIVAHLSRVDVVFGQVVKAGDQIGLSGNTGNSSGAHLHVTLRLDVTPRDNGFKGCSDPLPYIQEPLAVRLASLWREFTGGVA